MRSHSIQSETAIAFFAICATHSPALGRRMRCCADAAVNALDAKLQLSASGGIT